MKHTHQRLLDYLRAENPTPNSCPGRRRGLTKTKTDRWSEPEYIAVWKDFDYDSLRLIYGGDLRSLLESQHEFDTDRVIESSVLAITDEDSVTGLISDWNMPRVKRALSKAQANLEHSKNRRNIYMMRGGQANYPGSDSNYNPDWAGVQVLGEDFLQLEKASPCGATVKANQNTRKLLAENVLPGDSKPGKKWSSDQITVGPVQLEFEERKDWYYPLCQVFTYCIKCEVRYGYIITEKELVVLRVRPYTDDDEDNQSANTRILPGQKLSATARISKKGLVEFKAIPWTNNSQVSNTLTVNLALWWLHMLASRSTEIQDRYPHLKDETWTEQITHSRLTSMTDLETENTSTSSSGDLLTPMMVKDPRLQARMLTPESLNEDKFRYNTPDASDRDSKMSPVSQSMSRATIDTSPVYPTPDSVKQGNKRARSPENDDCDVDQFFPSGRKRRVLPANRS